MSGPHPVPGLPSTPGTPGTTAAHALVRVTLGSPELGDAGPLSLRVGQRLLAEVLAVQSDTGRTILSLAGRRLEAQLPAGLRQGEVVRLAVAEVLPDRLVFRLESAGAARVPEVPGGTSPAGAPRSPGAAGPGPSLDAARILAELDLPDTAPLRAAVGALIERQQPLGREALNQIRGAIAELPGDPALNARAAVYLRQESLPLTARSVALARAVLAGPTAAPVGGLVAEVLQALDHALDVTRDAPPAAGSAAGGDELPAAPVAIPSEGDAASSTRPRLAALRDQVARLAVSAPEAGEVSRVVRLFGRPPEAILAARAGVGRTADAAAGVAGEPAVPGDARQTTAAGTAPARMPGAGAAAVFTAAESAATAPSPVAEEPALTSEASARTVLVDAAEALPDETGAETADTAGPDAQRLGGRRLIATLHDRIELQQLRSASRGLAGRPVAAPLPEGAGASVQLGGRLLADAAAPASDTPTTRPLPSQAGDPPAAGPPRLDAPVTPLVVSIPLAIGGQYRTLELVVERDSSGRRSGGAEAIPPIRARFTLQLERLGEVGADVRLQGSLVRCRLSAASPGVAAHLAAAAGQLRERFERAGLEVQALDCSVVRPDAGAPPAAALRHVAMEA